MEIIYESLCSMTAFRGILSLPVMASVVEFSKTLEEEEASDGEIINLYSEIFYRLSDSGFCDLGSYLSYHLKYDEGPYPRAVTDTEKDWLRSAALRDITILKSLVDNCQEMKGALMQGVSPHLRDTLENLPEVIGGAICDLEELEEGYRRNGYGIYARGRAFLWDGYKVYLVKNPDALKFDEMTGYQWQRQEVLKNTRALIEGASASNILLHGYSGTGKSATVKSLIHIPEFYNLRIIEIAKSGMGKLRDLIRTLVGKRQKFILFIDDLSFSGEEEGYSALKSVLEGGLGMRPDNVVVYATSNRRHMVRESFGERQGDDVHVAETVQEKSSLADRFAIRIPYMALPKADFLKTVGNMALLEGIEIDTEELYERANKWEIAHGGRTPRVARQFIDYLLAECGR